MKTSSSSLASLLLILSFVIFFLSSCGLYEPNPVPGLPWSTLTGTTWYVMEDNGLAVERFTFYADSVIVDIDHFTVLSYTDSIGQVTYRERHKGTVYTKDKEKYVQDNHYSNPDTLLCTEIQWKRQGPAITDPQDWTSVYDWSVYQWWWIESVNDSVATFGDAPYSYDFLKKNPVKMVYGEGWIYDQFDNTIQL